MPRLLSINTYHYRRGGADVAYLEHDALFRELGWDTAVFAMHHPRNEPTEWSRYFVDEIEMGHDYPISRKVRMAGKVIYSFEARSKLARLLDDWRPDVAHAHNVHHHLSPSVLGILRQRGIPTVLTAHDLKLACPAYKMLNRHGICERCRSGNLLHVVRNRCIHDSFGLSSLIMVESSVHRLLGLYRRNLDRIVVPSRFYAGKLAEWGWPAEKLAYVPNFIQTDDFAPEYRPGNYFLYFGRLAPEKGLDLLIRAAAATGAELRITGTGPAETALRELAKPFPSIEFTGYCSGERLRELVQKSRALILPSQWYENAPLAILEAYASGKPVIGARVGGIGELIVEGETGFLFDMQNVDELAEHLRNLRSLPDVTVERIGRNARRYVETEFSRRRYAERMLNVYREIGVELDSRCDDAHGFSPVA